MKTIPRLKGREKRMKTITEMTPEEIITNFLQERGADVDDPKLRAEYPPDLLEKARQGDHGALISLLKVGHHRLTTSMV